MSPPVQREDKLSADLASLRIDRAAPPPRKRRGRRWLVIAAILLAAAGGAWWFVAHRAPAVTVAYVAVVQAGQGAAPVLSGSGYIVTADRYVSVGVRVPGRIDKYFVEEGQTVRKGDALVQIDNRDYHAAAARAAAQLEVAKANLALAEADLGRIRALREQNVVSAQELDVQQNKLSVGRATLAQVEAELSQAKVNLEYTTLRAPTDGVILAKQKEVGEIAMPGGFAGSGDLIRLANLTDMRAQVDVNEADLNRVNIGQPALVTPDAYPDAKYDAKVVKLYPQVDRQKGTLRVEVHILKPDEKLLPDMSARISFLSEPPPPGEVVKPVVLAPAKALRRDAHGGNYVWVVNSGQVHQVVVEAAGTTGDRVRIANGLKGGEALVVSEATLHDGQVVRVVP